MLRSKKGQSILEYLLILTVVIVAIIAARGVIGNRAGGLINETAAGLMERSGTDFTNQTENGTVPVGGNITNLTVPQLR